MLGRSVGLDRRITCNLHRKDDPSGVCLPALHCLSQFLSYGNERIQLFMALGPRTFYWWDRSIFIMDDHDDFPCWMMIQRLPHWVGDHSFLITN